MWWNLEKTNPEENKKTTTKLKIKQNKPKKKKKKECKGSTARCLLSRYVSWTKPAKSIKENHHMAICFLEAQSSLCWFYRWGKMGHLRQGVSAAWGELQRFCSFLPLRSPEMPAVASAHGQRCFQGSGPGGKKPGFSGYLIFYCPHSC